MYEAILRFPSKHPLEGVHALSFDDGGRYSRTESSIYIENNSIVIHIKAKDITALRAAINDYIRMGRVLEIDSLLS